MFEQIWKLAKIRKALSGNKLLTKSYHNTIHAAVNNSNLLMHIAQ
jgi:hypothetical protein